MIFVMVMGCVFFAVRAEYLNIIETCFSFKGLTLTIWAAKILSATVRL
jgi:hypothetical protein